MAPKVGHLLKDITLIILHAWVRDDRAAGVLQVLAGPPELINRLIACRQHPVNLKLDKGASAVPDAQTMPAEQQPAMQPTPPVPSQQAVSGSLPEAIACKATECIAAEPTAEVQAAVLEAPPADSKRVASMQQGALQMTERDGGSAACVGLEMDFAGADSLHSLPSFRSWGGAQRDRTAG